MEELPCDDEIIIIVVFIKKLFTWALYLYSTWSDYISILILLLKMMKSFLLAKSLHCLGMRARTRFAAGMARVHARTRSKTATWQPVLNRNLYVC